MEKEECRKPLLKDDSLFQGSKPRALACVAFSHTLPLPWILLLVLLRVNNLKVGLEESLQRTVFNEADQTAELRSPLVWLCVKSHYGVKVNVAVLQLEEVPAS